MDVDPNSGIPGREDHRGTIGCRAPAEQSAKGVLRHGIRVNGRCRDGKDRGIAGEEIHGQRRGHLVPTALQLDGNLSIIRHIQPGLRRGIHPGFKFGNFDIDHQVRGRITDRLRFDHHSGRRLNTGGREIHLVHAGGNDHIGRHAQRGGIRTRQQYQQGRVNSPDTPLATNAHRHRIAGNHVGLGRRSHEQGQIQPVINVHRQGHAAPETGDGQDPIIQPHAFAQGYPGNPDRQAGLPDVENATGRGDLEQGFIAGIERDV